MNKILIIGYVWPEPSSSAAGRHMMEIIQIFLDKDWEITYATPAVDSPYRVDLSTLGITEANIELNNESFDRWLEPIKPDVVIFDRFMMEEQFGWRVAQTCPQAIRVLDMEDLHFLRMARQQALKNEGQLELKNETAVREVASMLRCDLSLVISQLELDLLEKTFNLDSDILHYLPFMFDLPDEEVADYSARKDFVFVGTMRHAPNLDAIRYLKKVLWPKIRRQLPEVNLEIVGSYPTKEIMQMHKPSEGFLVLGKVDDLESLLINKRVSLAPLRYGAGLKGKLLEAMTFGSPSVTTKIGAEGIAGDMPWPGVIAQDDESFITAAVNLYSDREQWHQSQQAGFAILRERFSKQLHSKLLIHRLIEIRNNLDKHRKNNFMGMILQHSTIRSTEYMARWIECKNKIL